MGDLSTPPPATTLPEQFGKYSILGHLATGGMAEVYIARQAGLQGFEKVVVIKRIRPELIDVETTAFFLDEARLVATLEHPNIAQVYEIGLVNDSYFFVMEYVHGADLRQLLEASVRRQQTVTLANSLHIIIGVCAALHYAHDKCDLDGRHLGIIHRDVSPSNVLISHDGAVKVCDFGIARAATRTTDTSPGVVKGKFAYISPEQCRSEPLDRRSDVFAIGILLYELTTLSRLFDAPSDYELLRTITEEPIPSPSARVAGYPPELERIVLRALARKPAERYPTAQAMQLDLEAFAREHKLATSSIHVANAMGELFDKRPTPWPKPRPSQEFTAPKFDASPSESAHRPVFAPLGSGPEPDIIIERPPQPTPPDRGSPQRDALEVVAPRRRWRPAWLIGVGLAGLAIVAATIAETVIEKANRGSLRSSLETDAEQIGSTLDLAARAARMRVDGLAGSPMLRAAIETDAATIKDVFANELMFTPSRGEGLEVFQMRSGAATSMLRLPSSEAPMIPLLGREARVDLRDGGGLVITVGAPITDSNGKIGGVLDLAAAVDLEPVRRRVAEHALHARIVGLGQDLVLTSMGDTTGPSVTVAIPSSGEATALPLSLVAIPKSGAGLRWVAPTRYAGIGLAALFLVLSLLGRQRRE